MTVRVVDDSGVEGNYTKAAAQVRRAMERFTREDELVAFFSRHVHSFSQHSGLRKVGEVHWLGLKPIGAVFVVCALTRLPEQRPFALSIVMGLKRMMPKPLLEADAPTSGLHEGPRS